MPEFDRVTAIFHAAIEREGPEREALLDAECGDDLDLRAEVHSLLTAHDDAGRFLQVPAAMAAGFIGRPTAELAEGALLGHYKIERELGRGGMGIVYLAEDTRLGRNVALKVLAPEFVRDEHRRERMRIEARAAAALSHPGIAIVYALEELEGHLCLVSEYVRGETLRAQVERTSGRMPAGKGVGLASVPAARGALAPLHQDAVGPASVPAARGALAPLHQDVVGPASVPAVLSWDQLFDTGVQLAEALGAAHAAGVVHRDLKPENVMRDETGRIKILDFGVARFTAPTGLPFSRLTDPDVVLGTPAYMSPEQIEGEEVDGRSDIFALGVLLFELAAGTHPFETKTPASTAARVLAAEPPNLLELNPGTPPGFDAIIRRCLRKDPAERYRSASDVARSLAQLRGRPDVETGDDRSRAPSPTVASARRRTPRQWWVLHQAAVMCVATLMVWPVAWVYDVTRSDWTLALLLGVIVAAALDGTLRAHLLFTNAFNEADLRGQLERTMSWVRRSDWVFAVLLFASALPTVRSHTVVSAILAAVSVGWMATSLVIEPATRRAAFPGRSSGARRRQPAGT